MLKLKCSICGFDKYAGSLHIHHKDHNHQNNEESNLEVLCANCHMEHHHKNTFRTKKPKLVVGKDVDDLFPEYTESFEDKIIELERDKNYFYDIIQDLESDLKWYKKEYYIECYKTIYLNSWMLQHCNKEAVKYVQSILEKIKETGKPQ